ncbi:MAG: terpene cyclase/mutase family protein [Planctomycetia bacterium]|nr:terpene cyclase/mutase family protein [Planctomycetia bacterium]
MRILSLTLTLFIVSHSLAAEELTLDNVTPPAPNTVDEPLAAAFSLDNATRFLDQASLDWTKSRKCFTCHTNYSYLIARPTVSAEGTAHRQVREALEELVEKRWETSGPRWNAEVVMSAAVLAMNDAVTSGKLHATTRKALDRMWTLQRADGGFDWLKCDWPPMESDDDYGIAIAALAAGAAPDDYAKSEAARAGVQKLRDYLKANPPPTLHHTAMLMWADSYGTELLTPAESDTAKEKLFALQQPDGGWSLATLGNWTRGDGNEQDTSVSDGYGTGFVVFVLRQAGIAADDARLQRGVSWLKQHQRESGRWYSRSLHKDTKHFISHAGTAFAVMAIQACEPE